MNRHFPTPEEDNLGALLEYSLVICSRTANIIQYTVCASTENLYNYRTPFILATTL